MKQCSTCKEYKPVGFFYRKRTAADGLTSDCKKCRQKSARGRYHEDVDKSRADCRRRDRENRDKIKAKGDTENLFELSASVLKYCGICKIEKAREEFYRNSWAKDGLATCCKKCRKDYQNGESRFRRYGISVAEFDEMMLNQGGMCAICDKESKLHVDHNHTTKKVRALLCMKCNTALGHLEDSVELVTKAVEYLKKHLTILV